MKKKKFINNWNWTWCKFSISFWNLMTQANKSMALEEIKLDDGKTNTSSSGNVYTDGVFVVLVELIKR